MKTLLAILFTATLTTLTFGQKDTSKYVLAIKQVKNEKTAQKTFWIVSTTVTNNSNETLKYLSMSCSWQEFYYVDNNKMSIDVGVCTKNGPIIVNLAPNESVNKEIKLQIKQDNGGFNKIKFKIGMNLLQVKNENTTSQLYDEFLKDKFMKNIIWSNSIEM